MLHDGGHSFLWMSASQKIPLSGLAQNLDKGLAREISYETGRRRGKARSQSCQQKIWVSDSQGKAMIKERGDCWRRCWDQWTEKPGQPTREDESAFLVAVWEFCSSTRSWQSQKHRIPEKCPNFSLLTLRANPSSCLFVLLSSTLGYICYICYIFVKHVKCLRPEMRGTTRRSDGHELI